MVTLVSGGALLEHTTLDMLPQLMSLLMQKLPAVQQLTSRLMKSVLERKCEIVYIGSDGFRQGRSQAGDIHDSQLQPLCRPEGRSQQGGGGFLWRSNPNYPGRRMCFLPSGAWLGTTSLDKHFMEFLE